MILLQLLTEFGHFRIMYVGGNRVVGVPTIFDLHLLGESCILKHRIPGECSSVVSTIQLGTPKFDNICFKSPFNTTSDQLRVRCEDVILNGTAP